MLHFSLSSPQDALRGLLGNLIEKTFKDVLSVGNYNSKYPYVKGKGKYRAERLLDSDSFTFFFFFLNLLESNEGFVAKETCTSAMTSLLAFIPQALLPKHELPSECPTHSSSSEHHAAALPWFALTLPGRHPSLLRWMRLSLECRATAHVSSW